MNRYLTVCIALAATLFSLDQASAAPSVGANQVFEQALTGTQRHADPFNDITLDVVFTDPAGKQLRVPAFWVGGNTWKVRYASPRIGTHTFVSQCSDAGDGGLNGVRGQVEVVPYRGDNPLFRHGALRVADDHRHFAHADGTPFFWLGDTWWEGLCKRISDDEFRQLSDDRRAKGFDVVQIVAGLYPDEPPFDPRGENAGGWVWEKNYSRVNPAYFDDADRRIECLVDHQIAPCVVSSWGYYLPWMGVEKLKKHWRYIIARWGALPVVWCLAGEVTMPYYRSHHRKEESQQQRDSWTEIARYLRKTDPFGRLITSHPGMTMSGRLEVTDESLMDFDMLQTGHGGWDAAPQTVALLSSHYAKLPAMPVVDGEVTYEGHMAGNWPDVQRFMFWTCILNGAAGHTYGAGGIWQMNGKDQPHGPSPLGGTYENTPWDEAAQLPGSRQLGIGKALLMQYPWWQFTPHPEWLEPHGTTLLESHTDWYDALARWKKGKGNWQLAYAAGIPGKVRFIYIPRRQYQWSAPLLKGLEAGVRYRAFYFDPIKGDRHDLGTLPAGVTQWRPPQIPTCQDWVLVLERST